MSKQALALLAFGAVVIVAIGAARALSQAFPLPIDPDHFPG